MNINNIFLNYIPVTAHECKAPQEISTMLRPVNVGIRTGDT